MQDNGIQEMGKTGHSAQKAKPIMWDKKAYRTQHTHDTGSRHRKQSTWDM